MRRIKNRYIINYSAIDMSDGTILDEHKNEEAYAMTEKEAINTVFFRVTMQHIMRNVKVVVHQVETHWDGI